MADQDKWTEDRNRGRYAQEDRFRRGFDEYGRRGDYSAGDRDRPGYGRGYSEGYGDYGRSFERDRSAARAYGAGYGIDEDRHRAAQQGEGRLGEGGYGDRRYGGRWGRGPEGSPGEPHDAARYGQSDDYARRQGYGGQGYGGQGYGGGQGWRGGEARHAGEQDRTWMERAGERVASFFGGGEVERSHRGRGPKNYTRSDERIREDVNDWLTDDPYVDASEVEVQVANGEVTLSGTVTQRDDRRRAEDLAERVSGVRHVQNNIRVQAQDPPEPLPVPMV